MKKVKKLGRPNTINWDAFKSAWKVMTDASIAELAHCSQTNVHLKRKKLIVEAQAKGQKGQNFVCKLPKWTHRSKAGKVAA